MHLPLLIALIMFVAIATSATFGFGSALVGMPLLTAILGLQIAAPLFNLAGTTAAFFIVLLSWKRIVVGAAWRLFLGTIVGIPLGILLIRTVPEPLVVGALGIILTLFGIYRWVDAPLPKLHHPKWGYGFGFIAGILGGAYNTSGPPVVIYGTMERWPPTRFQATIQGYFFPTALTILVSHGLAGSWTDQVLNLYLWSIPSILAGVSIGRYFNQRVSPQRFKSLISMLLIALGIMLLWGIAK